MTGPHDRPDERAVAPFGAWASPIDVELLSGTSIGLAEPRADGDVVCWLETRPTQAGRRTLLRHGADGATRELTPAPFNVRDRVHEYGGGSYAIGGGRVVASSVADGRLWRLDPEGVADPVAITPEGPWRFGDLWFDAGRDRVLAVRETHPDEPGRIDLVRNELVAVALDGSDGEGRVLVSGPDFVAGARPSPDGRHLAWIEWDHPAMPWDATRLRVAEVLGDGSLGPARTVTGRPRRVGEPARLEPGRRPPRDLRRDRLVEPLRVRRAGRGRRPGAEPRADGRRGRRADVGAGLGDVRSSWPTGRSWRPCGPTAARSSCASSPTAPSATSRRPSASPTASRRRARARSRSRAARARRGASCGSTATAR